jgi:DNA-binding CsgD family transcriptional regulator
MEILLVVCRHHGAPPPVLHPRVTIDRGGTPAGRQPRAKYPALVPWPPAPAGTTGRDAEPVSRRPWPLVGRAHELAAIDTFLRSASGSIIFSGEPGTGKTRLLAEIEQRAQQEGRTSLRVVASQSASSVPLGAFASLLPPPTRHREAPANVIAEAVAFVARHRDPVDLDADDAEALDEHGQAEVRGYQLVRGVVLIVDDAHWLDGASAALVQQVAVGGLAHVAMTVRTGERVPDAITALWKDGIADRLDVGPLSRSVIDDLLTEVLPGVANATREVLWKACEGNPLYLRELVLGAIDSGALVDGERGWHVTGSLVRSPRLLELVEARLADLSPDQRAVLELLAISGPIGLGLLESLVSLDAAEAVERLGLAVTRTEGRRRELQLAHPLHGEVLRGQMPAITAMGINRRLAAAVEQLGARRRDDILRVSLWRLEGGGVGNPDLLLLAADHAHAARNEALAERLARAALEAGAAADAALLLAVVLGEFGRQQELEALLADVAQRAELDDRTRALVAAKRAINLLWGLRRDADADAVLDDAADRLPAGPARDEVTCERAVLAVLRGHAARAIELAEPLRDADDPRVAVRAALALGPALRLAGRPNDVLAVADRGWMLQNDLADHRGFGSAGTHVITRLSAMTELGDFTGAEALARAAVEVTDASGDGMGIGWAAWVSGAIACDAGRLQQSAACFERAEAAWRSIGQDGPARWATSGRLLVAAMSTDPSGIAAHRAALLAGEPGPMTIEEPDAQRALAWASWCLGDERAAVTQLATIAQGALEHGDVVHAARAAHDLARLGATAAAADAWRAMPAVTDWPVGEARGEHVTALAAQDGAALLDVSERFASLGWSLFAAEAAAQAAGVFRRASEGRKAERAAAQSARLLARCEGAATPALAEVGSAASLSVREREIAGLAARGLSNREIAERLTLSERTIENHLQRAYVKLGVTARTHLADALRLG